MFLKMIVKVPCQMSSKGSKFDLYSIARISIQCPGIHPQKLDWHSVHGSL